MSADRELLELAAKAYWSSEIDDVMSFHWDEQEAAIVYTHADNQDHNGNDVESFTSVTKTAAPVGELPELPEPFALSVSVHDGEHCKWPLVECMLYQKHPNEKQKLYTADQMRAYARAALSAGDAVDAQRLDFIEKSARCDPKMDGQHVWWPTSLNTALPTAEQVDDINVAESFTSVTKTAAPVGEQEVFERTMMDKFGWQQEDFMLDNFGYFDGYTDTAWIRRKPEQP